MWRPVFSGFSVQLVCRRGSGSRPAGQPHPEGAAPQGSAGHQPGEAPCLAAAAVHQHPFPGRTLKRGASIAECEPEVSECRLALGRLFVKVLKVLRSQNNVALLWFCREIRSTVGWVARVNLHLCVCFSCFGGILCWSFWLDICRRGSCQPVCVCSGPSAFL